MQVSDMLSRTPGLPSVEQNTTADLASDSSVFRLNPDEMADPIVNERLNAAKHGTCEEITSRPAEQFARWAVEILSDEPNAAIGKIFNTVNKLFEPEQKMKLLPWST